jgi:hypothetical protein
MTIINKRTKLSKYIIMADYTVQELDSIYKFWSAHDDYDLIIDGEVQ